MLAEFRLKNYRSFRDEHALNLVAGTDSTLSDNCVDMGKLRLLKAAGIYGPNASGKSNLIKAINDMKELVLNSADAKPDAWIPIKPFLLDDPSQKQPTFFEVTFYLDGIRYQYGFTATTKRIQEEWLFAFPKGRSQLWYERKLKKSDNEYKWVFGTSLKGDKRQLTNKTRENVLFLSVAAQWNHEQLTSTVYRWFNDHLQTIAPRDVLKPLTARELYSEVEEGKGNKLQKFVKFFLENADLGIDGVSIKKAKIGNITFLEDTPKEIRERAMLHFKENPRLIVELQHHNMETDKKYNLPLDDESNGTQRLFELAFPWMQTVSHGITVFVDELESSLHPLLTRELIKFILDPEINNSGAQLIFATHDTTLLDPDLFRRDQIWFTEKDKKNVTNLYPLSDYKPRIGEAMQKGYLAGRYGAIPILEAFSLK